jgi:hypothetical protein
MLQISEMNIRTGLIANNFQSFSSILNLFNA